MNYQEEFRRWKNSGMLNAQELEELSAAENNPELLQLHFGCVLSFGTAGLRGVMAVGPGCMNRFTVGQATQGLANLIVGIGAQQRGVAVAYDSRNRSEEFARTAACTLAANGIRVFLFDAPRPTPELSFTVRDLHCIAGINITASHNPKQYNGYKAYWEDGAQLPPDHADTVSAEIAGIDLFSGIRSVDFDTACRDGRIRILSDEADDRYIQAVLSTAIQPENVAEVADRLAIVYTPLHGTGHILVPRVLRSIGLTQLSTVPEQMVLDGNFPTVEKPNPEIPDAFRLGVALAEKIGSDLVIATDPDADRVGVMSRRKDGSFTTITGNQMGALLLDYVIAARRATGKTPYKPYAVKSIVSTEMVRRICEQNQVKLYDVLTGFKFIGEVIKNHEEGGEEGSFIFGFEESYGYLFGGYARDKDAVSATMIICEMTAFYRKRNMTLSDALEELYRRYGYYMDTTYDIYMEGLDGTERREKLMRRLRENPPRTLGGHSIVEIGDYLEGVFRRTDSGVTRPTGQPKSDVISFLTDCDDKILIRPSGTEPKVKIYLLTHAEDQADLAPKTQAYLRDSKALAE